MVKNKILFKLVDVKKEALSLKVTNKTHSHFLTPNFPVGGFPVKLLVDHCVDNPTVQGILNAFFKELLLSEYQHSVLMSKWNKTDSKKELVTRITASYKESIDFLIIMYLNVYAVESRRNALIQVS